MVSEIISVTPTGIHSRLQYLLPSDPLILLILGQPGLAHVGFFFHFGLAFRFFPPIVQKGEYARVCACAYLPLSNS